MNIYIYIYIYIEREREIAKDPDVQGIDLVRFFISRGRIPRLIGDFTEIHTQRFLVCGLLLCGLTVIQMFVRKVWTSTNPYVT